MKVVTIVGPFTAPTAWEIEQNVRRAELAAKMIADAGAMPWCPHANTRFFHGLLTPEFWYEGTMEFVKRADAVLLLHGWENSKGSVAEWDLALKLGKPVFHMGQIFEMVTWINQHD
jgi:hypothetical protein